MRTHRGAAQPSDGLPAGAPGAPLRPAASAVPPPVDATCTWHQRISAPVEQIWPEVATLDAILGGLPGLTTEVALDGRTATVLLPLRWGPWSSIVPGDAALHHPRPPTHLLMALHLPALAVEYRCTCDLAAVGADVSNLRVEGHLRCAHRSLRRRRALLDEIVENHVRAVADTATRRAQGRYQARLRLSEPHQTRATSLPTANDQPPTRRRNIIDRSGYRPRIETSERPDSRAEGLSDVPALRRDATVESEPHCPACPPGVIPMRNEKHGARPPPGKTPVLDQGVVQHRPLG